jgi:hypothetical protein
MLLTVYKECFDSYDFLSLWTQTAPAVLPVGTNLMASISQGLDNRNDFRETRACLLQLQDLLGPNELSAVLTRPQKYAQKGGHPPHFCPYAATRPPGMLFAWQ